MSLTQSLSFVQEYWVDAWQRSILTLDLLRERGSISLEHNAQNAPNVLSFKFDPILDGRTLPRPVNYDAGASSRSTTSRSIRRSRPIVVDPRAGHGPGIGGMKQDEIGVAMAAGHPCYFIGFFRSPCPARPSRTCAWLKRRSLPGGGAPSEAEASPSSSPTARPAGRS
jgi:hypothetical protein